jgi:hypothetical protein
MLLEFYRAVLPPDGPYALFRAGTKRHTWCPTTEELASATQRFGDATDIYFATASYLEPTRRTQDNVAALKALRLDLDAGPEKFAQHGDRVYETQRAALADLVNFARRTGIAPTYIISSGTGLHVYYCFDEEQPRLEWETAAGMLARIAAAEGLKADTSVTEDAARILRPIGTLHPSGNRVTILKDTGKRWDFLDLLSMLTAIDPKPSVAAPIHGQSSLKANVSLNSDFVEYEGPPKSAEKIAGACAQVAAIRDTQGDGSYEHWRGVIGIIRHCHEGLPKAIEWTARRAETGHAQADAEDKFNNWEGGPPTCDHFRRHNAAGCAGCPHAGKIKSPIVLGFVNDQERAEIPPEQLPPPKPLPKQPRMPWDGKIVGKHFVVVDDEGMRLCVKHLVVTAKDEDGAPISSEVVDTVSDTVFWLGSWAEANHTDDSAIVMLHTYRAGRVRGYQMPEGIVASTPKLLEFLAEKSVQASSHAKAAKLMQDYVKEQLKRIRGIAQRPKVHDRFGLRITERGELICAQGRHVIYPTGEVREAILSERVRKAANGFSLPIPDNTDCVWAPTVWRDHVLPRAKEHVEFFKKYYAEPGLAKYRLAIMLGLASPLMPFAQGSYLRGDDLPPQGVTVSLYSRGSGKGKTTVVKALMAAYGNVETLVKDGNDLGSTDLGRSAKASIWGTMPLAMDEMGGTRPGAVAELVSMIANGSSRVGMTKDGGLREGSTWALVNMMMANASQRDMISAAREGNSAIQFRLLEINVDDVVRFDDTSLDGFNRDLAHVSSACAGALGGLIHLAICRAGVTKINEMVSAQVNEARRLVEAKQEARFQYRLLGLALVLQELLTNAGLAFFDRDELIRTFRGVFDDGVEYVEETVLPTDGLELMAMILRAARPNTVITQNESHRGYANSYDVMLNARMPDLIEARHVISGGYTYIASDFVRNWAISHSVNDRDIIKACKDHGVLLVPDRSFPDRYTAALDLTKGMREGGAAVTRVYKIDARQLWLHLGVGGMDDGAGNVVPLRSDAAPGVDSPVGAAGLRE